MRPALTRMRHDLIRAELARSGGVRIRDLMTRLGVSRATVRRDLRAIVDAGDAVSARGGVLLPADRTARGVAAREHGAIVNAAAKAIVTDEVKDLGLFGGPLIHELARRLTDQSHLHVVTNSLVVARVLSERSSNCGPQMTLLPGMLHACGAVLGRLAADALAEFHLDATYFDCVGFDSHVGATVDDLYEAGLRRLSIQVADRAVLLVERANVGAYALGSFAAPCDLDAVIDAQQR